MPQSSTRDVRKQDTRPTADLLLPAFPGPFRRLTAGMAPAVVIGMMLTRSDVAEHYTLNDHGTITQPGKFESEPWYAVALYNLTLEGGADETIDDNGLLYDVFMVDDDMRAAFDLDPTVYAIVTWESETGFFNLNALDHGEYDTWVAVIEDDMRAAGMGDDES